MYICALFRCQLNSRCFTIGLEDVESLTLLSQEEVEELSVSINMKLGHKRKLLVAIRKAREELEKLEKREKEMEEKREKEKAKRERAEAEREKEKREQKRLAQELAKLDRKQKLSQVQADRAGGDVGEGTGQER
jgi:hypothetical protein